QGKGFTKMGNLDSTVKSIPFLVDIPSLQRSVITAVLSFLRRVRSSAIKTN
ncbi:hypothetical protein PROFUN_11914, partial [Planoprotostelium fungivorum]